MTLVLVLFAALAAATGLGALVRHVARRTGGIVVARTDRWHKEPTPTFGGVAIAGATLAVSGVAVTFHGLPPDVWPALMVSAGAAVMFAVGFIDDRLQLTPLTKLLASLTVGSFLLFGLAAASGTPLAWWQTVLLVIGYAAGVHAFNLLDNMDGLAGGVALVAVVVLLGLFSVEMGPAFTFLLVAFGGGLAGFLVWNLRPARLFMGDCGSLFIGAMLAGITIALLVRRDATFVVDGIALGLVLVVPLLDTTFVLVVRRLAGLHASRGGTDHLSHRLVSAGLSERLAVLVLYAIGALGGATAWVFRSDGTLGVPAAALFGVGVVFVAIYLARIPAYNGEDFRVLQKSSFAPFLRDVAFRWHALEMMLDVALISVVFYLSYRLRFEGQQLEAFLPSFTASLPAVLGCKLVALYVSGAYSRLWGSFGIRDAFALLQGVLLGSVGSILVASYVYRFERFSRGVFLIDAVLLALVLLSVRGAFQAMGEATSVRRPRAKRVLIYGAGSAGQLLVREMRANAEWNAAPVAFLDDDVVKHRRVLMGIPIRGSAESIEAVLTRYRIAEVILSTTAIEAERERQVRESCAARGIPVKRFRLEITE